MSLIELKNVSKYYNNRCLYKEVNLNINMGDKVVIVGENGVGKTTLLNIMYGSIDVETGQVKVEKSKICFLNQLFDFSQNTLVDEYINQLFGEVLYLEKMICIKAEEISNCDMKSNVFQEYIELSDKFESKGGYSFLEEIKKFINIFDLKKMMGKKCLELSGGQKQYLRLALSLFSDKDIIFLDEPSSYLDEKKIKWLINYIKSSNKTFVIISHDEYIIKNIANKVVNISNKEVVLFPYGYKRYLEEEERYKANKKQNNKTTDKEISKKIETIKKKIEWMRKAENKHSHAVTVKRLQREIEKLEKEKIEFDDNTYSYEYEVQNKETEKKMYVNINEIKKSYGYKNVLTNCSLNIYSDSKIVIVGENGSGKTTLLKIIAGEELPEEGNIITDNSVSIGMVKQDFLNETSNTILNYCIMKSGKGINIVEEALNKLFDERKIDIHNRVSILSGGERKRLEIMIKVISEPDLLILDEPTVYMDDYSKNHIFKLINSFNGAVLIVTHDNELIEKLLINGFDILCINNGRLEDCNLSNF